MNIKISSSDTLIFTFRKESDVLDLFSTEANENFEATILRIGYTQGELSEDFSDFPDAFNAPNHCYWGFMVFEDLSGERSNVFFLVDLKSSEGYAFENDEGVSRKIGEICEKSSEDMFGRPIVASAFEALSLASFDEPSGYSCMDDVLDVIGGTLEQDYGSAISKEFVNSLFCISIPISEECIRIANGKIIIENDILDEALSNNAKNKLVFFTEDVMKYM